MSKNFPLLSFSPTERQVVIALHSIEGIGRQTLLRFCTLQEKLQMSWEELWCSEKAWKVAKLTRRQEEQIRTFQKRYTPAGFSEKLLEKKIETLLYSDTAYPELLRTIDDYPPVLFMKGEKRLLQNFCIAVVGTRHMSAYGEFATQKITRELVLCDTTIVSGFMYGVDEKAHRTAVAEKGESIGVLGFGFNYYYPAHLKNFFVEFLSAGNTLVTEFAPEVTPHKGNFPIRNRIVAALSQGVVVVEAAEKSGSLITAQHAVDYNRSVCAVPSAITSPFCEGTKNLINEGARLVTSGYEVIEEVAPERLLQAVRENRQRTEQKLAQTSTSGTGTARSTNSPSSASSVNTASQPQNLLTACLVQLSVGQLTIDQLSAVLQRPISEVAAALTILELNTKVVQKGGKWQCNEGSKM